MALADRAFGLPNIASKTEKEKLNGTEAPFFYLPGELRIAPELPPIPEQTKISLEGFLSQGGEIRFISILPDLSETMSGAAVSYRITDPELVKGLRSPFMIKNIQTPSAENPRFGLQLYKDGDTSSEEPAVTGEGPEERINGLLASDKMKDRYGNITVITRMKYTDTRSDEPAWGIRELAFISPPRPFVESPANMKNPIPFNFEIPFENGKEAEGFIYLTPEAPILSIENYPIFGNALQLGSPSEMRDRFEKPLREVIQGLDAADQMFGGQRKFVKGILLRQFGKSTNNITIKKAFVEFSTPHIASINVGTLLRKEGQNDITGFHEAIHSIDTEFGISSHPLFKLLFRELPAEFFEKIAETNFLGVPGGHPRSNELELLASLINSFNHPNLEGKILSMDPDFLKHYLSSLITLRDVLGELGQAIPRGAAIFGLLNERILFLEKTLEVNKKTPRQE